MTRLIFNFLSRLIFNNLEHVVQKINQKITQFIPYAGCQGGGPFVYTFTSPVTTPSKSIDYNQEPGKFTVHNNSNYIKNI